MGIILDILKEIPLSAVLREQLTNHETKMAVLEKESLVLKKEKLILSVENLVLKNKNSNLESSITDLRQKIQRRDDVIQKEKSQNNLLDKVSINVLELLFRQDNLTSEQIAQSLSIKLQMAKFHLKELKANGMLKQQTIYHDPPPSDNWFKRKGVLVWALEQKGRKYLINNKIAS